MRRLSSLVAIVLSGCASAQSTQLPVQETRAHTTIDAPSGQIDVTLTHDPSIAKQTVAVSLDDVWGALPAAYAHLGLPVNAIDTRTHLLGTGVVMVHRSLAGTSLSTYLECGADVTGQDKANFYSVQLDVRTQLDAAPDSGTIVRTMVEATGRDAASSNNPVRCSTKGLLEHRLVELLGTVQK
jgi:hypothetical protein